MKYIQLPDDTTRRLSFYLAMEEYLAQRVDRHDLLFMWQVRPTVIFGRNQQLENEVNTDYCASHGIEMYRRKSGGGCVYADMGNIMFSYITCDTDVNLTFSRFMSMLELLLHRLGVEATTTKHNDVLVDGKKVSGTAFYHLPHASIVHCTMLYDTTMEHMESAITPAKEKLQKNGVQSVRQRIGLLKDYIDMSIDEFKHFARQTLCEDTLTLTEADVKAIEKVEEKYLDDSFINQK